MTSQSRNTRYSRRNRLQLIILPLAIILLLLIGVSWVKDVTAADTPQKMVTITVKSGDTLWGLAKKYGDPDEYILQRVSAIVDINKLQGDQALYAGQTLKIPVADKS